MIAVVGISTDATCGVRDHATLLTDAIERDGVDCQTCWLTREARSFAGARAEVRGWLERTAAELDAARPDAVLLHYSVFPFSYRGVPVFVPATLRALRRPQRRLVTLLHEYAYPWGRGGARGALWALTQRALLCEVVRASDALAVTGDFRVPWLASRRWLPAREIAVAPVFSNLPAPSAGREASGGEAATIGLFGYASEGTAAALVLDALALLHARGVPARLRLLGSPGSSSAAGGAWQDAAERLGLGAALEFTGTLAAQRLSDELATCDVLLSADPSGPTSRKTTLAASLASGAPVVAIDGPHRWPALSRAGAARVAAPTPDALADALAELLADPEARRALGAHGRAFALREMTPERSARTLLALLAPDDAGRERSPRERATPAAR